MDQGDEHGLDDFLVKVASTDHNFLVKVQRHLLTNENGETR